MCKNRFATATGVTHHLESGSCSGARGLSRTQIYKFVRSKDPNGLVTKSLIGWSGSDDKYEADERSWNGHAYECYFCHRQFRHLSSLNQHLQSPTRKLNIIATDVFLEMLTHSLFYQINKHCTTARIELAAWSSRVWLL